MKYLRPPTRLLAILFALTLPLTLVKAQLDLYIGCDLLFSGINDTLYFNGNVVYAAGAGKLNQVPYSAFYFTGNFINNNISQNVFYEDLNPLLRSRGAVVADQGYPQQIGGPGKINFYSLEVKKVLTTQEVTLTNEISMYNKLKMTKGDVNVGTQHVTFTTKDTASNIVGESDFNRIYGTTGYLQTKRFVNSTLSSPANLGLTFNNLQDSVLVKRFFTTQLTAADGSIERYYEVRNSNGSITTAYGQSAYLDTTETNGHGQAKNLRMFRSTDHGATWLLLSSTVDTNLNKVTANSIQGITSDTVRYTLADFDCANPPIDSLGADTAFCNGDSLLLNAGSGVGYHYLWSTGDTTQTVWVAATSVMWVEVANDRGCITRDTISVTRNGLPFVSLALGQDTVSGCAGAPFLLDAGNTGSTFLWNNLATTQMISLTHTDTLIGYDTVWVAVIDTNGCTASDTVIYKKLPAPVVNLGGTRNSCGGSNAVLNAALPGHSGNVGPTYLWNTGVTLASITVGTTGAYNVTVTNGYGCQAADTVQVNVAPSIVAAATAVNVTCNGFVDGSVNLNVSGGTPGFTFLWGNGATTQNLTYLGPGTYNLTVTDALGCLANASAAVTQPTALTRTMGGTNVTCNGAADGSASVSVTGGTPPYAYLWSSGATTSSITGLGQGTYMVTVTDGNGCTITGSRLISEPQVLAVSLGSLQDVGCNGGANGQIDINVTGGTTTYSYLWSNGATTQDVNGLAAGTYGVTVTDAHACTAGGSYTVAEPTVIMLSETHLDALCNGGATGSIDLTASGGTPAYSYQWSNASTTQDLGGMGAGSYAVTVTDANGCTATTGATIAEPTAMVVTATTVSAACGQSDGAAATHVAGGTPGYTYNWPSLGSTLDSVPNIPAGIYVVFVTDANGCVDSVSATVNNAGAPTLSVTAFTDVTCNGGTNGSLTVALSGGTPPFTYLWSNGDTTLAIVGLGAGTYDLTVTASNGCQAFASQLIGEPSAITAAGIVTDASCFGATDGAIDYIPAGGVTPYAYLWSNSATTQDLVGVGAGFFGVTLTDANGCTRVDTFTVAAPGGMTASNTFTNVSCGAGSDGGIDLTVAGGTPAYSYNWSSGQISEDLTGLVAGSYTVTVTDQNGCQVLGNATITEPLPITLSLDSTDVQCNGGTDGGIDLAVAGGTIPYLYNWSNGATTEDLTALTTGSYDVTVTDSLGCTIIGSTFIIEPTLLTITLGATDVHCGGNANGTAFAIATGGTGSYHYNWSNSDTTSNIAGLAAGSFGVTVTDDNGCTVTGTVTVIEPPTLTFAATIVDVTCQDQADGSIMTSAFGGSLPYTYDWDIGDTIANLIAVPTGDYVLTLTDSAGCTFTDTLTVGEGDSALSAEFLVATVVNSEDSIYFLELSVPIPTTVYWDFGDGGHDSVGHAWHIFADNPNVDTSYYQVSVAVANAWCRDTLVKQVTVVNRTGKFHQGPGQNGIGDILNVAVYPNPNMGAFSLDISMRKTIDATVKVIDLNGRLVTRQALTGDNRYHVEFQLGDKIAAGVYLVSIQVGEIQKILRIVKF